MQPQLSAQQSAEIYRQLTKITLNEVCSSKLCEVQLWCSPDINHVFFGELESQYSLTLKTQSQGDLGTRMNVALSEGLRNFRQVILIGSDCPSLTNTEFEAALTALNGNYDAVLAPTEDGGYSLVGLTRPAPDIFKGINWSTPEVLDTTREKMRSEKLNCFELPLQWDVDCYVDYLRLMKAKERSRNNFNN